MMKSFKLFSAAVAVTMVALLLAAFNNMNIKQENEGFAVLELFTSEGCSSCPPADELVELVQKENPGKQLYILAYHVDYWDHQGWKDPYSDADYSKRQSRYANWFGLSSIYTPQIVVNGTKEFVGSNRTALISAITEGIQKVSSTRLEQSSTVKNGQISINYQTDGKPGKAELVMALIQKSAGQHKVGAGENSGRTLKHVQVVRNLAVGPLKAKNGNVTIDLPKDYNENEWEVIGFIQDKANGKILAAAKSPA